MYSLSAFQFYDCRSGPITVRLLQQHLTSTSRKTHPAPMSVRSISCCTACFPNLTPRSTDKLIGLHWLRVPKRIFSKLVVLTYRDVDDTVPGYLQSCFTRLDNGCGSLLPVVCQYRQFISLSGRQASFPSFRRQHTEWPSSTPCHICTATHGFQTAS